MKKLLAIIFTILAVGLCHSGFAQDPTEEIFDSDNLLDWDRLQATVAVEAPVDFSSDETPDGITLRRNEGTTVLDGSLSATSNDIFTVNDWEVASWIQNTQTRAAVEDSIQSDTLFFTTDDADGNIDNITWDTLTNIFIQFQYAIVDPNSTIPSADVGNDVFQVLVRDNARDSSEWTVVGDLSDFDMTEEDGLFRLTDSLQIDRNFNGGPGLDPNNFSGDTLRQDLEFALVLQSGPIEQAGQIRISGVTLQADTISAGVGSRARFRLFDDARTNRFQAQDAGDDNIDEILDVQSVKLEGRGDGNTNPWELATDNFATKIRTSDVETVLSNVRGVQQNGDSASFFIEQNIPASIGLERSYIFEITYRTNSPDNQSRVEIEGFLATAATNVGQGTSNVTSISTTTTGTYTLNLPNTTGANGTDFVTIIDTLNAATALSAVVDLFNPDPNKNDTVAYVTKFIVDDLANLDLLSYDLRQVTVFDGDQDMPETYQEYIDNVDEIFNVTDLDGPESEDFDLIFPPRELDNPGQAEVPYSFELGFFSTLLDTVSNSPVGSFRSWGFSSDGVDNNKFGGGLDPTGLDDGAAATITGDDSTFFIDETLRVRGEFNPEPNQNSYFLSFDWLLDDGVSPDGTTAEFDKFFGFKFDNPVITGDDLLDGNLQGSVESDITINFVTYTDTGDTLANEVIWSEEDFENLVATTRVRFETTGDSIAVYDEDPFGGVPENAADTNTFLDSLKGNYYSSLIDVTELLSNAAVDSFAFVVRYQGDNGGSFTIDNIGLTASSFAQYDFALFNPFEYAKVPQKQKDDSVNLSLIVRKNFNSNDNFDSTRININGTVNGDDMGFEDENPDLFGYVLTGDTILFETDAIDQPLGIRTETFGFRPDNLGFPIPRNIPLLDGMNEFSFEIEAATIPAQFDQELDNDTLGFNIEITENEYTRWNGNDVGNILVEGVEGSLGARFAFPEADTLNEITIVFDDAVSDDSSRFFVNIIKLDDADSTAGSVIATTDELVYGDTIEVSGNDGILDITFNNLLLDANSIYAVLINKRNELQLNVVRDEATRGEYIEGGELGGLNVGDNVTDLEYLSQRSQTIEENPDFEGNPAITLTTGALPVAVTFDDAEYTDTDFNNRAGAEDIAIAFVGAPFSVTVEVTQTDPDDTVTFELDTFDPLALADWLDTTFTIVDDTIYRVTLSGTPGPDDVGTFIGGLNAFTDGDTLEYGDGLNADDTGFRVNVVEDLGIAFVDSDTDYEETFDGSTIPDDYILDNTPNNSGTDTWSVVSDSLVIKFNAGAAQDERILSIPIEIAQPEEDEDVFLDLDYVVNQTMDTSFNENAVVNIYLTDFDQSPYPNLDNLGTLIWSTDDLTDQQLADGEVAAGVDSAYLIPEAIEDALIAGAQDTLALLLVYSVKDGSNAATDADFKIDNIGLRIDADIDISVASVTNPAYRRVSKIQALSDNFDQPFTFTLQSNGQTIPPTVDVNIDVYKAKSGVNDTIASLDRTITSSDFNMNTFIGDTLFDITTPPPSGGVDTIVYVVNISGISGNKALAAEQLAQDTLFVNENTYARWSGYDSNAVTIENDELGSLGVVFDFFETDNIDSVTYVLDGDADGEPYFFTITKLDNPDASSGEVVYQSTTLLAQEGENVITGLDIEVNNGDAYLFLINLLSNDAFSVVSDENTNLTTSEYVEGRLTTFDNSEDVDMTVDSLVRITDQGNLAFELGLSGSGAPPFFVRSATNTNPTPNNGPDRFIAFVGQEATIEIAVTDPDGDEVTFDMDGASDTDFLADWITDTTVVVDGENTILQLSGTPDQNDIGTFSVSGITASAGGESVAFFTNENGDVETTSIEVVVTTDDRGVFGFPYKERFDSLGSPIADGFPVDFILDNSDTLTWGVDTNNDQMVINRNSDDDETQSERFVTSPIAVPALADPTNEDYQFKFGYTASADFTDNARVQVYLTSPNGSEDSRIGLVWDSETDLNATSSVLVDSLFTQDDTLAFEVLYTATGGMDSATFSIDSICFVQDPDIRVDVVSVSDPEYSMLSRLQARELATDTVTYNVTSIGQTKPAGTLDVALNFADDLELPIPGDQASITDNFVITFGDPGTYEYIASVDVDGNDIVSSVVSDSIVITENMYSRWDGNNAGTIAIGNDSISGSMGAQFEIFDNDNIDSIFYTLDAAVDIPYNLSVIELDSEDASTGQVVYQSTVRLTDNGTNEYAENVDISVEAGMFYFVTVNKLSEDPISFVKDDGSNGQIVTGRLTNLDGEGVAMDELTDVTDQGDVAIKLFMGGGNKPFWSSTTLNPTKGGVDRVLTFVGQPLTIELEVTDLDGDEITFSDFDLEPDFLADWLTTDTIVDGNTATFVITGTPDENDIGVITGSLNASSKGQTIVYREDEDGMVVSGGFEIVVGTDNRGVFGFDYRETFQELEGESVIGDDDLPVDFLLDNSNVETWIVDGTQLTIDRNNDEGETQEERIITSPVSVPEIDAVEEDYLFRLVGEVSDDTTFVENANLAIWIVSPNGTRQQAAFWNSDSDFYSAVTSQGASDQFDAELPLPDSLFTSADTLAFELVYTSDAGDDAVSLAIDTIEFFSGRDVILDLALEPVEFTRLPRSQVGIEDLEPFTFTVTSTGQTTPTDVKATYTAVTDGGTELAKNEELDVTFSDGSFTLTPTLDLTEVLPLDFDDVSTIDFEVDLISNGDPDNRNTVMSMTDSVKIGGPQYSRWRWDTGAEVVVDAQTGGLGAQYEFDGTDVLDTLRIWFGASTNFANNPEFNVTVIELATPTSTTGTIVYTSPIQVASTAVQPVSLGATSVGEGSYVVLVNQLNNESIFIDNDSGVDSDGSYVTGTSQALSRVDGSGDLGLVLETQQDGGAPLFVSATGLVAQPMNALNRAVFTVGDPGEITFTYQSQNTTDDTLSFDLQVAPEFFESWLTAEVVNGENGISTVTLSGTPTEEDLGFFDADLLVTDRSNKSTFYFSDENTQGFSILVKGQRGVYALDYTEDFGANNGDPDVPAVPAGFNIPQDFLLLNTSTESWGINGTDDMVISRDPDSDQFEQLISAPVELPTVSEGIRYDLEFTWKLDNVRNFTRSGDLGDGVDGDANFADVRVFIVDADGEKMADATPIWEEDNEDLLESSTPALDTIGGAIFSDDRFLDDTYYTSIIDITEFAGQTVSVMFEYESNNDTGVDGDATFTMDEMSILSNEGTVQLGILARAEYDNVPSSQADEDNEELNFGFIVVNRGNIIPADAEVSWAVRDDANDLVLFNTLPVSALTFDDGIAEATDVYAPEEDGTYTFEVTVGGDNNNPPLGFQDNDADVVEVGGLDYVRTNGATDFAETIGFLDGLGSEFTINDDKGFFLDSVNVQFADGSDEGMFGITIVTDDEAQTVVATTVKSPTQAKDNEEVGVSFGGTFLPQGDYIVMVEPIDEDGNNELRIARDNDVVGNYVRGDASGTLTKVGQFEDGENELNDIGNLRIDLVEKENDAPVFIVMDDNLAMTVTEVDIRAVEGVESITRILVRDSVNNVEAPLIEQITGLPLIYDLPEAWVSLDGDDIIVITIPDSADAGSLTGKILATDNFETSDLEINVTIEANPSPVFTTDPVLEAFVGVAYEYTATGIDPLGETVTASEVLTPDWLSSAVDGANITLTGTPGEDDINQNNTVKIALTDEAGAETEQTFDIKIFNEEARGPAPVFVTDPVTSATVGEAYSYSVKVNASQDFTVTTLTATSALPDTTFTFTDNGNGEGLLASASVAATPGDFAVSLLAVDSKGDSTTQDFTITVEAAPDPNQAPTFSSVPSDATVQSGTNYEATISATDPDGDDVVINATEFPEWALFEVTSNGEAIFEGHPTFEDIGQVDQFTVTVSDGEFTATASWTVTVEAGPDAGESEGEEEEEEAESEGEETEEEEAEVIAEKDPEVESFSAYPNPVEGSTITIASPSPTGTAYVIDNSGAVINTFNFVDKVSTIDLKGIDAGIYMIRIITSDGKDETMRIVIR